MAERQAHWLRGWRRRLRIAAEAIAIATAFGGLVMWCSIPSTARLASENPTTTAFIDLRRDEAEAAGKTWQLHWRWRPIAKISRYLRAAVVFAEDANFYTHDGVDWNAVESAMENDLDHGAMRVGGSTITQQLAKNLYLSPRRSMLRKAREMLIAFALEDHLSKQRILELYLNVVEWGDGVFGAEAAARAWFGRSAAALTPAQAARLAVALPNPIERAPNKHDAELVTKSVRIVRLFRWEGLIDAAGERAALDELGATGAQVLPDRGTPVPVPEPEPEPEPEPDQGPVTSPSQTP
ncbi:MAG TPA: monofunctional biosynthetic peptidoglycan transglycosylase [Kofleriaceae bacterium]